MNFEKYIGIKAKVALLTFCIGSKIIFYQNLFVIILSSPSNPNPEGVEYLHFSHNLTFLINYNKSVPIIVLQTATLLGFTAKTTIL